jgi:TPR repeat protein
VDKFKAKELFKQAVRMGNSKAAIALGQMFQYDFYANAPEKDRFKFMITMYELSAEMGCPDAYVFLAEGYDKGWGVKRNPKKARELRKKAADLGSPKGLEFYGIEVSADPRAPGMVFTSDPKLRAEGRQYLERSMQLGNGDAGAVLFYLYKKEENIELMIKSLRQGAKFGSKASLYQLQRIYFKGQYGQYQDKEYAACFKRLEEAIDDFDSTKPISNFDQICLPRPIQPYLVGP